MLSRPALAFPLSSFLKAILFRARAYACRCYQPLTSRHGFLKLIRSAMARHLPDAMTRRYDAHIDVIFAYYGLLAALLAIPYMLD